MRKWLLFLPMLILVGVFTFVFLNREASAPDTALPPVNSDNSGALPNPADVVTLDFPKAGSVVKSPLIITGKAKGFWFFEASFPVKIVDANGNVLGQHHAQATDEWMTVEFVPFTSSLTFKNSPTDTGFLILQRDNPSGLPQYDQEIRFPVKFR